MKLIRAHEPDTPHYTIHDTRWWYLVPFILSFIQKNFFLLHRPFSFGFVSPKNSEGISKEAATISPLAWDIFIAICVANDFDKLVSDDIWKIVIITIHSIDHSMAVVSKGLATQWVHKTTTLHSLFAENEWQIWLHLVSPAHKHYSHEWSINGCIPTCIPYRPHRQ